jgi:opacity protein-like surface antigen
MNIKSLLIGSAAALAAVSGAQAADAIVAAEPEPLEYVRVCDAFGTGFFYIPGTETCLKFGGYIRFQTNFGRDSSGTSDWDSFTLTTVLLLLRAFSLTRPSSNSAA